MTAPIEYNQLCVKCIVKAVSYAFTPCEHKCLCEDCSVNIKTCPVCCLGGHWGLTSSGYSYERLTYKHVEHLPPPDLDWIKKHYNGKASLRGYNVYCAVYIERFGLMPRGSVFGHMSVDQREQWHKVAKEYNEFKSSL